MNSTFEYDLKIGQLKEKELSSIFSDKTIEVKTDLKSIETGNLFIEFENRGKLSGIATTKADYYCLVFNKDSFFIIATDRLKELCRGCKIVEGGEQSKGVLLPIAKLLFYAATQ